MRGLGVQGIGVYRDTIMSRCRESLVKTYIEPAMTVADIDFMKSELVLWSSDRIEENTTECFNKSLQ